MQSSQSSKLRSEDSSSERGFVQHVPISEDSAGQRIDNFLFTFLKGVPKTRVYRCVRKGEVRVNKGRVKPDYKLCSGDMVRIPPLRQGPKGLSEASRVLAKTLDNSKTLSLESLGSNTLGSGSMGSDTMDPKTLGSNTMGTSTMDPKTLDSKKTEPLDSKALNSKRSDSKYLSQNSLAYRLVQNILHEDDELLILNKPSGVAVHGGSGVSLGVIEALRSIHPRWASLELVHRLDRDTSGCLMIAKKKSTLRGLHEQLKTGQIEKVYLTLVKGAWKGDRTWAEFRLTKNQLSSGERIVKVDEAGQTAVTEFRVVQRFCSRTFEGRDKKESKDSNTSSLAFNNFINSTLMEARPLTGRTHQIRVHAQALGYPIAGDPKYGEDEYNRALKKFGFNRLFLHAKQLQIILPKSGETLKVEAPFDENLSSIINYLEGGTSHG